MAKLWYFSFNMVFINIKTYEKEIKRINESIFRTIQAF